MPHDDNVNNDKNASSSTLSASKSQGSRHSFFSVPASVKRIFDKVPLVTYAENKLPLRAPRVGSEHLLWIFTSEDGAETGRPSFNPSCLKWQTYLKICAVQFRTIPSNNHASPSGSLPFLMPKERYQSPSEAGTVIPANKLQKWVKENGQRPEESPDARLEAYLSLVDHSIRRAWLHSLYSTPNFERIVVPNYIHPISTSNLIQLATAYELQTAAETELRKFSAIVDVDKLYGDAEQAFEALESLLADGDWFFGTSRPSLFDAAVFSYTHLLLDEEVEHKWADRRLHSLTATRSRLVAHRNRILNMYY
ncbi:hypothetical protein NA57DRAFT_70626 [Rhizodiscina lignyota]|uniref:Metaxin glutathione S-transferase domain-containing protein n=1 Tax=Rhizodiscina lignyota TaxID=1504668 RepID=A0A9P4IRE9_9PEZI|nr:hypothetical protein NA57DRAFT_70626 [Rhizodiscina lignyota]